MSDASEVWERHEAIAEQMVEMIRAWDDPGLEGVADQLTEVANSAEHPAMLSSILALQVANLLDTYTHDLGDPKVN